MKALPILIEIFRAGRHTSAGGEAISFSQQDVEDIAASYDPNLHKAPCVLGHPKDNDPAYGWADALGVRGNTLVASVVDAERNFAEGVNAKRHPKVSASLYRPDSPSNPKPGKYYLRHIGFLGAMPPAVKGLAEASFSSGETDKDSFTLEFAEVAPMVPAAAPPAHVPPVAGATPAVPTPADAATAAAAAAAMSPELEAVMKSLPPTLDEATKEKIKTALGTILVAAAPAKGESVEHAEARRGLETREAALKASERAHRRKQNEDFWLGLRHRGIMLPISKEMTLAFMDLLHGDSRDVVSFGEGDTRSPDEIFRNDFLSRIPPEVDFREVARSAGEVTESTPDLARRAATYQRDERAKGNNISTTKAVEHVSRRS